MGPTLLYSLRFLRNLEQKSDPIGDQARAQIAECGTFYAHLDRKVPTGTIGSPHSVLVLVPLVLLLVVPMGYQTQIAERFAPTPKGKYLQVL